MFPPYFKIKLAISEKEKALNLMPFSSIDGRLHCDFFQVMDLKDSALPFSAPAPTLRKTPLKSQEQQVNPALPSASLAEVSVSSLDAAENGNNQEGEGMILNPLSLSLCVSVYLSIFRREDQVL